MLHRLRTYVNEGNQYYGLELCEQGNNTLYHLLHLEHKKQELVILGEDTFSSLEAAVEAIQKEVPVFLVIHTTQVLVKVLAATTETNQEALVHSAFPNLDFNDFYYELAQDKKNLMIAIGRKEPVNAYVDELSNRQVSVFQVFLGSTPVLNVLDYLPEGTVALSNKHLDWKDGIIQNVAPISDDSPLGAQVYDVSGLSIKSTHLLGFSAVLGHLLQHDRGKGNLEEAKGKLQSEFTHKRRFKLLLKSALAFVLGLLLLNFLFFNHYFERVGALQEALAIHKANKEQLVRLNAEVKTKEERLNAVLAMANSKTSAWLDAIARRLPSSVLLSEIEYQPLQRPLREGKPVELEKNVLILSGAASDNGDFYNWIAQLEQLDWVDEVAATEYDYGTQNTSNFSINIRIYE